MSYLQQYDSIPAADARSRVGLVNGWIRTDTRAFFAELRERRPIFRTPAYTLVTRYRDVIDILIRDDLFTVRPYAPKMDPVVGPFMLGRDRQPLNWRHKSVMSSMMPMEDLPDVRALIGRIADKILDEAVPTGRLDAVKNLGRTVPVRMCGEYFGFPGPDEASMYRWSKATQSDFFKNIQGDPKVHETAVTAGAEMRDYLKGLIESRRAELAAGVGADRHDVLTRLLQTSFAPGAGLDEDELLTNMSGLLVGSVETTSQAIVQVLEQILLQPAVHKSALAAAKAGDSKALAAVVWEALRFNPINPLLFRLTSGETVLARGTSYETHLPANNLVFACSSSAMWDDSEIDNPDAFVPGRPSHHYLHFGYKAHECLGVHVGEVMVPETVGRVLLRENVHLLDGDEGKIDFENGPFPEKFLIGFRQAQTATA